jgi:predicted TIM-barrel fold metal-dependent hydrolase
VLAHAGGLMPYFAWRLSVAPMIDARLPQVPPEQIIARLGQFWFDTALSPAPQTMACLAAVARPQRIVFGTDWPFANAKVVAHAMQTAASTADPQRNAIDRGNALSLFPQFG